MGQQYLYTDRLLLRKFTIDDYEDLYEYLSNSEVVQYEPYDVYTIEECSEEVKFRSEDENQRFWAVCLKENKKVIGHVYFNKEEPMEFKTWELGYVFNPKFYGQGYATEACKRILKYGFEEKNAHRIVAEVNVKNESSWKLLERLSMRREGHMLQNVFFKTTLDGKSIWNDSYRYGILYEEHR